MRLTLPSGASVELDERAPPIVAPQGIFAEQMTGIRASFERDARPVTLAELPLSDLHSLRAILQKTGQIADPELSLECRNCGHEFRVVPSSSFELGPYLDAELTDPALDAPFDFDRDHEIEPGDPRYASVRLRDVTVGEAGSLLEALSRPFRITSKVVRAMGIVALGDVSSPLRIARRLREAPDEIFDRVGAVFEDAHYPPRLSAPHACPECGVVEWLPLPSDRELTLAAEGSARQARSDAEPFIDLDAFEERVRTIADRVYRELGVTNIDLSVIEGPAECDDAGEPLLGCYRPPAPEALIPRRAEVRIFYRTFATLWEDDGPYDVAHEIEVTLSHELEHHLGHLTGSDPLDDDELAVIEYEQARRVGRRETQRRAVRAFGGDFLEFLRRTWWLWLLALVATLLTLRR